MGKFRLWLAGKLFSLADWVSPLSQWQLAQLDSIKYGTGIVRVNPKELYKAAPKTLEEE